MSDLIAQASLYKSEWRLHASARPFPNKKAVINQICFDCMD